MNLNFNIWSEEEKSRIYHYLNTYPTYSPIKIAKMVEHLYETRSDKAIISYIYNKIYARAIRLLNQIVGQYGAVTEEHLEEIAKKTSLNKARLYYLLTKHNIKHEGINIKLKLVSDKIAKEGVPATPKTHKPVVPQVKLAIPQVQEPTTILPMSFVQKMLNSVPTDSKANIEVSKKSIKIEISLP